MALIPQRANVNPLTLTRVMDRGTLGAQNVQNVQNQLLNQEAAQQDIDFRQQYNPLLVTAQEQANQINQMNIDQSGDERVTRSLYAGYKAIEPYISDANPSLENRDTIQNILRNRVREIEMRGGDPSDTLEAMKAVDEGNYEQVRAWGRELAARVGEGQESDAVQSSQILPDGTTVQVMRGGGVRVVDAQGRQMTGEQATQAVKDAQQYGVDIQGERSNRRRTGTLEADVALGGQAEGTKDAAKQAIRISGEAFEQIPGIRSSISNIDEAIRLIDEGANTGAIESRLPSVKEASIKLDNLQGRMGLNVIQNTTFGALSGPELRFALDTALPKGLEGPALQEWLRDKKASQQKLVAYLESAAEYLGRPGNTVAGFLEMQRNKRREAPQPGAEQQNQQISPEDANAQQNIKNLSDEDLLRF